MSQFRGHSCELQCFRLLNRLGWHRGSAVGLFPGGAQIGKMFLMLSVAVCVYVCIYIYECAPRCRLNSLTDFIRIRCLKLIQNRSTPSELELRK
jgi:hypothetical protein